MRTRKQLWTTVLVFLLASLHATAGEPDSLAAPADPWSDPGLNRGIEERIEKHRKGAIVLQLRDLDGTPLPNLAVTVELRRHAFRFGIGITAFFEGYDAKQRPTKLFIRDPEDPRVPKHYESLNRLFNHGTVPVYWQMLQAGADRLDLRPVEESLDVQKRFGWTLEAHPLYWPIFLDAPRLPEGEELPDTRENRLAYWGNLAKATGGRIEMWNVVNETLRKWGRPEQREKLDGEVTWALKEADKVFPDAKLSINELTPIAHDLPEGGGPNAYHKLVTRMLQAGCRIDAIGFQFHAGEPCDPNDLLTVYNSFASFGLPLYISEVSMLRSGDRPKRVRNLYRLWFSVPQIESITWWNWQRTDNRNYTKKCLVNEKMEPIDDTYAALDKLINDDWHTRVEDRSDGDGNLALRGFYGAYKATVTHDNEQHTFEFEIEPGGPQDIEWVVTP